MNTNEKSKTSSFDFNRPRLKRLKAALTKAQKDGGETFIFDGHEFLCSYAKYLVEYLESKLP